MAGGYGRGAGIPLKDRLRVDSTSATPAPPRDFSESGGSPARHCWVAVPGEGGPLRAGLLLGWRRCPELDGSWQGQIVYVQQLREAEWAAVIEWVPADRLTPAAPM